MSEITFKQAIDKDFCKTLKHGRYNLSDKDGYLEVTKSNFLNYSFVYLKSECSFCKKVDYHPHSADNEIFCSDECEKKYEEDANKKKVDKKIIEFRKSVKDNGEKFAFKSGVGKRHLPCAFENYEGEKSFIREWSKNRSDNILITGKNAGTGKTHLAVSILKYIGENFATESSYVKFITFSKLMMHIRSSFNERSVESEEFIIETYSKYPVLIIDDIGAEKVSEYSVSVLYLILNSRYEKMIPTISTTNMTSEEMSLAYHQRIVSRLASGYIVKIKGDDRRLNKDKVF